jgi:ribosomal protein L24E
MELRFCQFCGGAIYPEDVAPVKLEVKGVLHQFFFHNRHPRDCLAQKIDDLKQRFAAQAQ